MRSPAQMIDHPSAEQRQLMERQQQNADLFLARTDASSPSADRPFERNARVNDVGAAAVR